MHVLHVVGARPNFMKVAPVLAALDRRPAVTQSLVHTGQHYDANMSDVFFKQLGIRRPDVNLGIGLGTQTVQTAHIMLRLEPVLLERRPDFVLVYGDVNSAMAAALVCAKLGISLGHVEAGLRSFDRAMPEERNRLVTDQLADLLFTPSKDGDGNLIREGVGRERILRVGNVMIDTLVRLMPQVSKPRLSVEPGPYALVTLHRPSNVDDGAMLERLLGALSKLSERLSVIFPIHPRTRRRIKDFNIPIPVGRRMLMIDPIGYLEFLALQRDATVVVTDSGGIQEETTFLRIPCLTLRENTERPITVEIGTNKLLGQKPELLASEVDIVLEGKWKRGEIPELWDGRAGERIADIIEKWGRSGCILAGAALGQEGG